MLFLVLNDNGGNVSEILNFVFENFILADCIVYKQLLILLANLIVRGYERNDFNQHVLSFLNRIHRDNSNYGLDICTLTDIQYYANYVAGALSVKTNLINSPVFKMEDSGFNDVVVGYDMGIEIAQHKNI